MKNLLAKIKEIKSEYHDSFPAPVTEEEIQLFSQVFYSKFNRPIPQEYQEFLRLSNGLEENGCIIYSIQNLLENQYDYDSIADDYIIFAEYDIAWFCMERSTGRYCELDKPSGDEMQNFDTFEDMIEYVLKLSICS